MTYQDFLKTPFWKKLTARKKRLVGGKCEACGIRRQLQSHHVRYPQNWFDTELSDLKVLCDGCHKSAHGISTPRGFWDEDLDLDNFFWAATELQTEMLHGIRLNRRRKKYIRRMMERYHRDCRVEFQVKNLLKSNNQQRNWFT